MLADAVVAVKAAYAPPVARSPTSKSDADANGERRPVLREFRFMSLLFQMVVRWNDEVRLFEHVDDEEQSNPHNINEVPIVRNDNGARRLFVTEILDTVRAANHEEERDQATRHVKSVEAGGQIKRGSVGVAAEHDAFRNELRVFKNLPRNEDGAQSIGEEEPFDHAPLRGLPARRTRLHALCGENTELGGK